MAFNSAGLINLITLVDRTNSDQVVLLARRATVVPKVVRPFAAGLLAYVMLSYFAGLGSKAAIAAVAVGTLMFIVNFIDEKMMGNIERNSSRISMWCAVIVMFIGLAATLIAKDSVLVVLAFTLGGFCAVWIIAKIGIVLLSLIVRLVSTFLFAFSLPVAAPILATFAYLNNRRMQTRHKDWVTTRGVQIVTFDSSGVKQVNHDNEPIFVSSSRINVNGRAQMEGVPLFTLGELSNSEIINNRNAMALQNLRRGNGNVPSSFIYETLEEQTRLHINPATGLPLIGDVGSIDIAGNYYGFDSHAPGMNVYDPIPGFDG